MELKCSGLLATDNVIRPAKRQDSGLPAAPALIPELSWIYRKLEAIFVSLAAFVGVIFQVPQRRSDSFVMRSQLCVYIKFRSSSVNHNQGH